MNARDPWLWPFAWDSIWNMPLGDGAVYESEGCLPFNNPYVHADVEYHVKTKASDPIHPIYGVPNWTKRCSDISEPQGTMHIPDDLIVPDAIDEPGRYETPNNVAVFLQPNGRTLVQLEPLARIERGGPVFGYRWLEDLDLQGPGIGGTHWGSGLSGLGGSIRSGELTGPNPIRHPLKLNVWGNYLYFDHETGKGYQWPADRHDAYAQGQYFGTNPQVRMGSLLAIHPEATPEKLGLRTVPGRKLFHALQDYGAYIADDTGWEAYAFSISQEAVVEFEEQYGYCFNQGADTEGSAKDYYEDWRLLIINLWVISNQGPDRIGGGGQPRAPLAPKDFLPVDPG